MICVVLAIEVVRTVVEHPSAMLATVELAQFVDGIAQHVERCHSTALGAHYYATFCDRLIVH